MLSISIMHQSSISTALSYGDSLGIAGLRCRAITFYLALQSRGSAGEIILGPDFLLCRVGQRTGLLPSACPHRAGLIPGL